MELFKKLTEFLTPPPVPNPSKRIFEPWRAEGTDLAASVRPLLRKLVAAPTLNDPAVRESLTKLKQLASQRGLYLTAFETKNQLDLLPQSGEGGHPHYKSRGYVLAADFFLGHIRQELDGIKSRSRSVGPNVFHGYCNEMIGCLLLGENPRRAVEIPVLVIDELVSTAADSPEQSEVFLELASQTVSSALDLVSEHLEVQGGKSAFRSSNGISDDGTSPPQPAPKRIDEDTERYLVGIQRSVTDAREVFARAGAAKAADTADQANPPPTQNLNHYQSLLQVTTETTYPPLAAMLLERLGLLLKGLDPKQAQSYFESAGERLESQGDAECALSLDKLCALRYRKARELFAKAGADARARQVTEKMGASAARKTP